MNDLKLDELTVDNLGDWPLPIKLIVAVALCAGVLTGSYFQFVEPQYVNLDKEEKTEETLKKEFANKQRKASNLENYKLQMIEMKESFGTMLRQLPNKAEIADLLVEVSQTGLASGLDFKSFEPKEELKKDFYSEVPINIAVLGKYHEFGDFISGLASLPRIVTIHNVNLERIKDKSSEEKGLLKLNAIAKTYRYLDEEEENEK